MPTTTTKEREAFYKDLAARPGFRTYSEGEERYYVPEDVRTAAATALSLAAKELGIADPLLILWYVADDDEDKGFSDWAEPQIVFVRATKSYQEAMAVVAHEVRHLKQIRDGYSKHAGEPVRVAKEAEAEQFHQKFMRQFWPR